MATGSSPDPRTGGPSAVRRPLSWGRIGLDALLILAGTAGLAALARTVDPAAPLLCVLAVPVAGFTASTVVSRGRLAHVAVVAALLMTAGVLWQAFGAATSPRGQHAQLAIDRGSVIVAAALLVALQAAVGAGFGRLLLRLRRASL